MKPSSLKMNAIFITVIIFIMAFKLNAAYLEFVPVTLHQPNFQTLHVYASGDEFYNWVHDSRGYTIIKDKLNIYVYAKLVDGKLVPTEYIAGTCDPEKIPLKPWLKEIPKDINKQIADYKATLVKPRLKGYQQHDAALVNNTGTINNIVIFIRFADEAEWTDQVSTYEGMFNQLSTSSMKNYFLEASYNALTIQTKLYPETGGSTVISYQDAQTRNYYRPYDANTNPTGYQNSTQRRDREHMMLANCVNSVSGQIPASLNIDNDNDGYVDNICFIVSGSPDAWASLLWPHMWSLYSQTVNINNKRVYYYNLQIRSMTTTGVVCHEMCHTLSLPDLYHYSSNGISTVYSWDVMENTANPPQSMGAYMKYRYGKWIASIPEITTSGVYTLNPITSATNNCYKIKSPNSTTEYFVVEYRKKAGIFESSIPGSGLIVYRINTSYDGQGNSNGPPDEVYIYRPDGTTSTNGTPSNANFSSESGRTAINNATNPSSFLSTGSAGYLNISQVTSASNTISFTVGFDNIAIPTLLLPTDLAANVDIKPTFSWNAFTGATSYRFQLSTASDFSSFVVNQSGVTATTYTPANNLSLNTRYYWRINAQLGSGPTAWSNVFSFTTSAGITINSITGNLCAGNSIAINYTPTITFNSNNMFSAQLSDSLGNFKTPTVIGKLVTPSAGTIIGYLPDTLSGGSKYRIRVIGDNPQTIGKDNGVDLMITAALSPYIYGKTQACEIATENYVTSLVAGVSNKWYLLEGGTLLTRDDSTGIKVKWGSTGQGRIKLVKKSVAGCADSTTITININPIPVPVITGNLNVCEGNNEVYKAVLTSSLKNEWSVTGGKVVTILNPEMAKIQWGAIGKGVITLKQTNLNTGCFTIINKDVTINQLPKPDSIKGSLSLCPNVEDLYYSKAAKSMKNTWSVTGGKITRTINNDSILVSFTGGVPAKITLIQSNTVSGCLDTIEKSVTVLTSPAPHIIGTLNGCSGVGSDYSTTEKAGLSYLWSVTNGTIVGDSSKPNIKVIWNIAGTGKLKLTETNGNSCTAAISNDINISDLPPKPTITGNGIMLKSSAVQGNQWYFGGVAIPNAYDQNHFPQKNGSYTVQVTLNECNSEMSDKFTVDFAYVSDIANEIIIVYPNPASDYLTVQSNIDTKFEITSIFGIKLMDGISGEKLNISKLPAGIYFIHSGQYIARFIKL